MQAQVRRVEEALAEALQVQGVQEGRDAQEVQEALSRRQGPQAQAGPARRRHPTPPATPAPGAAPPAQSDVEKVTAALIGTKLQYFTYSNTSGASDDERYTFCSGTFQYVRNRVAISGIAYDSFGGGTWQITQAKLNPMGCRARRSCTTC